MRARSQPLAMATLAALLAQPIPTVGSIAPTAALGASPDAPGQNRNIKLSVAGD